MLTAANLNGAGALPATAAVAACALTFTIGSFWWLNARQGALRSYTPHSFAATVTPSKTLIRLPLVFFNTGPKPIIVQNLRLTIFDTTEGTVKLPWSTTRDRIRPEKGDDPRLPSVFVVNGRSAVQIFTEFSIPFPDFIPDHREHQVVIECKLGHKRHWVKLLAFPLQLGNITRPAAYIAYSNEPGEISPQDRTTAAAELEKLRSAT